MGWATKYPTPQNIPVLSLALTTKDHHLSIIEVFQPCDPPKQPGALLNIKVACKWMFILPKNGIVWCTYIYTYIHTYIHTYISTPKKKWEQIRKVKSYWKNCPFSCRSFWRLPAYRPIDSFQGPSKAAQQVQVRWVLARCFDIATSHGVQGGKAAFCD